MSDSGCCDASVLAGAPICEVAHPGFGTPQARSSELEGQRRDQVLTPQRVRLRPFTAAARPCFSGYFFASDRNRQSALGNDGPPTYAASDQRTRRQ